MPIRSKALRWLLAVAASVFLVAGGVWYFLGKQDPREESRARALQKFMAGAKSDLGSKSDPRIRELYLEGRELTREPNLEPRHIERMLQIMQTLLGGQQPDISSNTDESRAIRDRFSLGGLIEAELSTRLMLDKDVSAESRAASAKLFRWMLDHVDPYVRRGAISALADSGLCADPAYRKWLVDAKGDPDSEVAALARLKISHIEVIEARQKARQPTGPS